MVKGDIDKEVIVAVKNVSNPGSAIGEAVGKLIELEIASVVRNIAEKKFNLNLDVGGPIPGRRKGKKLLMKDKPGNAFEIDMVIEDSEYNPLVLIETKWLRYKKHNRDKGSWVCTAHYSLRKKFPSIKKTMAILMGSWSATSIQLIRSFGIEVHHIPYDYVVNVLGKYGIPFHWEEKDRETATIAWNKFNDLSEEQMDEIGHKITKRIEPSIKKSLIACLSNEQSINSIEEIEVTIKTDLGQFFNKNFDTIEEVIDYIKEFEC